MKQRVAFEIANVRVIGDLFLPPGAGPHPAVVLAGPMTSVKEQVTGVYAAAMAVRGIAALSLDHRHYGESGGEPRQYEHHEHKVRDLVDAAGWLAEQTAIDPKRVGLLGVCLGCGYASHAALAQPLVKALGLVAGYYRDPAAIRARDPEGFLRTLAQGERARLRYEGTGEVEMIPAAALEGDAAMTLSDTFEYYATPRAGVPNYRNELAVMSREVFLPFDVLSAAPRIAVPVCMVHSEGALSPAWARRFHAHLRSPARLEWLESTCQVDFYDQLDLVNGAADVVAKHFHASL